MVFYQLQEVKRTDDPNYLIFMCHHYVVDVVVAHDAGSDVNVVVCGDSIHMFWHDMADGCAVVVSFGQVGGGDDAHRFIICIDDGDRTDVVFSHDVPDVTKGLMGDGCHHAFLHDVSNFNVHLSELKGFKYIVTNVSLKNKPETWAEKKTIGQLSSFLLRIL